MSRIKKIVSYGQNVIDINFSDNLSYRVSQFLAQKVYKSLNIVDDVTEPMMCTRELGRVGYKNFGFKFNSVKEIFHLASVVYDSLKLFYSI